MPDVHVTLFTDRQDAMDLEGALFDAVELLPLAEGLGSSWGSGLLGKVRAFVRAPYERSLYLDTDTRVLKPRIGELFDLLETHELAIAPCEPGESRNQMLSNRPMFNSGVIAFCDTTTVRQLLNAWLERQEAHAKVIRTNQMNDVEYLRHLGGVDKFYQLIADQTALARYLAPDVNSFDVNHLALSRIWNWRQDEIDEAYVGQVVIHHAPKFKIDVPSADDKPLLPGGGDRPPQC